tara:strand:- start:345 stop:488 length:144 start_codon:yes stop_codon:yes gene_type:complete
MGAYWGSAGNTPLFEERFRIGFSKFKTHVCFLKNFSPVKNITQGRLK